MREVDKAAGIYDPTGFPTDDDVLGDTSLGLVPVPDDTSPVTFKSFPIMGRSMSRPEPRCQARRNFRRPVSTGPAAGRIPAGGRMSYNGSLNFPRASLPKVRPAGGESCLS